MGPADGWVNLARVYQKEGRIPEALEALEKAARHQEPAAPWVINWLTGQINVRNGMLDEAIQNFESVLNTKIPSRKLDFGLDYFVINELAAAWYARARIEAVKSPERQEFLKKTIDAYRRTIAIDSEDVAAHYGLGLAYGDPAWGDKTAGALGAGGGEGEAIASDALLELAATIAAPMGRGDATARRDLALRLARDVARYMDGPRPRFESRLEPLYDVVEILGPAWDVETDPAARAALARALEVSHKRLHERLKPDETAEGLAFRLARKRDPAANHNAQSIVIHSLHRAGAPGIDLPAAQVGSSPAATIPAAAATAPSPPLASENGE
jgi:tetratricopeptide (TPR) repeat protein